MPGAPLPPPLPSRAWPMRRVIQQHEHGCGIACVAMLAGVSYATACFDIFGCATTISMT